MNNVCYISHNVSHLILAGPPQGQVVGDGLSHGPTQTQTQSADVRRIN